ncbi:unnamed protein product [Rhodiola kirilowii]
MEDDSASKKKITDLIKELVLRLTSSSSLNPNSNDHDFLKSLRYAIRILTSRMSPSIAPDSAAMAESIKRHLATQGNSSKALTFSELYTRGCDLGGLPALFEDDFRISDDSKALNRGREHGVLFVMKDPENIRELAFREYVNLLKEESEVSEEVLVRDVLYTCQGVDGTYIRFDSKTGEYSLNDAIKVTRATKNIVRKLCELGGLFRRVKTYISESMDRFPAEDVGTIGQAFCAAMQDELSEYYKLLAVLESQSMNPIPLVSESATSGNYLSLRRLSVWFVEPMVKMRLMATLVDKCRSLRGGAMVGAIHLHAQHGDPLVHEFMKPCQSGVSVEGRLSATCWNASFIHFPVSRSAHLRAGKSINFLRVCCDDRGWADAAAEAASAAGTTTGRGGLGYGETEALESLVSEASKRIDKHMLDVIYKQYRFKEHCLAIKRYLLLGQGDFVQYLMDIVGPELSEPANTISTFKLAGLLESAIRSSNAQYDDRDILDRLRVKMMPHGTGDRGWDVFSLEYDARVPLDTVFTESVMARYLKIFNFLWKLRRVEHALIGAWKTMKPNCTTSHFFTKLQGTVKLQLLSALRRCQVLWDEMNHFVSNLQYYIMFEVLEVSWSNFSNEMEVAKDLDDLLAAHEKYLNSIVEKSLLGERSQTLYKTLFVLFDLILRFRSHADRLYEGITELQARSAVSSLSSRDKVKGVRPAKDKSSEPGSWLSGGRKSSNATCCSLQLPLSSEIHLGCFDLTVVYDKLGEGDKRWIVEERPDGANVHNWHWAETDCLEWSRNLLSNLLSNFTVLDGEGNLYIKTKKVDKVEGEAYVNVRKGKIIPGYEISVNISWEGEAKDGDGNTLLKAEGNVEIPYIADENADEDPEIRFTVRDDGPVGKRLKDAMATKGKQLILEKVRVYVESMAKGGPAKDNLQAKKAPAKSGNEVSAGTASNQRQGLCRIMVKARDLYEILMDDNRWKGFTQSNAKISKEVGGEFSIFDGSVTGKNVELQESKLIVQKWRFGSWADDIYSTVRITLDEPSPGYTTLTLKQTDVPEEDRYGNATVVENTERGWRELIFHKIRAVFGFGI